MENKRNITVAKLLDSDELFISADTASAVLECSAQRIRDMARTKPELLGFPVTVIKSRILIPRVAFLKYCGLR